MADLKEKFFTLTRKTYIEQAKWYLNAFWLEGAEQDSENVWKFAQKFIELDSKKKEGNELDEFFSHKFLESLGETLTVIALREKLRKIDMDANGKMALLEYLLFKFGKLPKDVVNAPQGGNPEEINLAQQKLDSVQSALVEMQAKEEDLRKGEAELKTAVDDLNAQETAYKNQVTTLEQKSTDSSASTVAKSKAAAELAQLKAENPLPLRKAKITQEAALRKVEKERKAAEAAVRDLEQKFQAAQDYLLEVKQKGGAPLGSMWWMERELKEAQKYLPKRKQIA